MKPCLSLDCASAISDMTPLMAMADLRMTLQLLRYDIVIEDYWHNSNTIVRICTDQSLLLRYHQVIDACVSNFPPPPEIAQY
jgi:hypothetical protein